MSRDDGVTIGRFGGNAFLAIVEGRPRERAFDVIGSAMERLRANSYESAGGSIPTSIDAAMHSSRRSDPAQRRDHAVHAPLAPLA